MMGAASRVLFMRVPRISSFTLPYSSSHVCFSALITPPSRSLHMSPSVGSPRMKKPSHPWPEWSSLVHRLLSGGFYNLHQLHLSESQEFVEDASKLPEDFLRSAQMCLSFARDHPCLLRTLSRKDIEVVVENGTPFLFKDGSDSLRKLRSFLGSNKDVDSQTISANTIDLMRFLLSYTSILTVPPFSFDSHYNKEIVEYSVRNLLTQLGVTTSDTKPPAPGNNSNPSDSFGSSHFVRRNTGMKKGDWICPRCNFMNFARNSKCLECEGGRPMDRFLVGEWECPKCFFRNFSRNSNCLKCEEVHPKRPTLIGREWECPQCDFFNYRKNAVCLKCNFKRPGDGVLPEFHMDLGFGSGNGISGNTNMPDTKALEPSDEKTKAFFQKISGLNLSEFMENHDNSDATKVRDKNVNLAIKKKFEDIFGNTSISESRTLSREQNSNSERPETAPSLTSSVVEISSKNTQGFSKATDSSSRADVHENQPDKESEKFSDVSQKPFEDLNYGRETSACRNPVKENVTETGSSLRNEVGCGGSLEGTTAGERVPLDMSEEAKTERWFKRIAQINDISELSEIPDEDFPTIMPLRKGVNRFVVSKRKTPLEKRLTSTQYRKSLPLVKSGPLKFDDE